MGAPGRAAGRDAERPTPDTERPTPAGGTDRPAAPALPGDRPAPSRPAPLDGNLHLKSVRRWRTDPSAEWTPHPSYGEEPGTRKTPGPTSDPVSGGTPGQQAGPVTGASPDRKAGPRPGGTPERKAPPRPGTAATGPGSDPAPLTRPGSDSAPLVRPGAAPAPTAASGTRPVTGPGTTAPDSGPDTALDLVLDLAPGDRAASATFSVPGPGERAGAGTGSVSVPLSLSVPPTTATPPPPGRRHSVIANEATASIPVHLLFRDDLEPAEAAAVPAAVARRAAAGEPTAATRRPPVPRAPRTRTPARVRPSSRPAPVADPRLTERPGPALPGYAALLTGTAGIAGALGVLWWRGVLPAAWQTPLGLAPRADAGLGAGAWALLALLATVVLLALGGLGRGRVGYAWVLTLFGDYRGTVRRTGLVWVSPLLLRRRVDVRLRHWRSEPLPAVDADGTALRVVVLVVWRIEDTVRAALGIEDHEAYLRAQVEAAMARVLSQLPADAFHEDAPTLRDAEAVGDALTRMLRADCAPAGVEVYSAQPTGIEYAPEVAAAMQRRRIAAIDARHRDSVLTSVVDAVDDTVNRLTTRGIVELDDYERKALVKDLTVAFYTGRGTGGDGA
ncbi:SPFH domain-containing protein [Streptomyces sp. NPDC049916]|uniref:SPFH domain-containing protein n=1 Tax=Streptomyces sp. NPDC049916 TaxID=3155156 RepID=UPI00343B6184